MTICTQFCERLKAINLNRNVLPSHDELVQHLQFSNDDKEQGQFLGLWQELTQRTRCGFCQLVVAAVCSSVTDEIREDQPISVFLFPSEQSLRLSFPSRLGLRLAFVADDAESAPGPDTARIFGNPSDYVFQIGSWLRTCDEKHQVCSAGHIQSEPENPLVARFSQSFHEDATSNFRVIDLELGCVRNVALDTKYMALSYVWGNVPMLKLISSNFEHLSTKGSLASIRQDLPKTINDAIDFVIALEERYLWVDALCLVQDDAEDVTLGLEMMNSIFQGAYFTIVAGSGGDANAGLFADDTNIEDNSHKPVQEVAPGLKMTILRSIDWLLSRSVYNSRGWTLQEIILPRRTVIFMNGHVHFRCQEANWCQETWADKWTHWLDPDDSNISRIPDTDDFTPFFWAYQKLCEEYSHRKLRNDGDALRALAGIIRPLTAGMETEVVEGLPGYYLDHFLLFVSANGDLRRRPEFASFSWAGWEGRIMWPRENYVSYDDDDGRRSWKTENIIKYLKENQIVQWSSLDSTAYLTGLSKNFTGYPSSALVKLMREHPQAFPDAEENPEKEIMNWRYYAISGSSLYSYKYEREEELSDDDTQLKSSAGRRRKRGFPIMAFNLANGQAEFDRLVRRIGEGTESRALQNWVASRMFYTRLAKHNRSAIGPRPTLIDEEDTQQLAFCKAREPISESKLDDRRGRSRRSTNGQEADRSHSPVPSFPPYTVLQFFAISIHLSLGAAVEQTPERRAHFDRIPGIPLLSLKQQPVGSLHPDNLSLLGAPGSDVECLVISRCNTPTQASALFSSHGDDTEHAWDLLWVIHVVWKDGIAERRGVGQILSSVLDEEMAVRPEVKFILLG